MNYILGFGLSTLGFLSSYQNKDIKILEKKPYNGGHAYSHQFKEFYFDEGVHILHSKNKNFLKLFLKKNNYISKSSKVINFYEGLWFKYPVQNNLLDIGPKIKYLTSYLTRPINEKPKNFLEWCTSTYGFEITKNFYNLYTKKYWNKDLDELDTSWLTGRVFDVNDEKVIKNTFFQNNESVETFNEFKYPKKNGFYGFFKKDFEKYKNIVSNNVKIKKIDLKKRMIIYNNHNKPYEKIYSSIPLPELKKYINFPKKISKCLDSLEYTSLYMINIIIKKGAIRNDHDWNYVYDKGSNISRISILNNINNIKTSKNIGLQLEMFKLGSEKYKLNLEKEINKFIKIFNIKKTDIVDFKNNFVEYSYIISKNSNKKNVSLIKNYLNKYEIYPFGLYGDWIYYWSDQSFMKGAAFGKKFNK